MNNLFFTALCLALLYYFFFYLPNQKNNANLPFKQNQATQTESEIEIIDPGPEKDELIATLKEDNHQKERTIIGLNNSYNRLETKKTQAIESLKADLTDSRQANQKLLGQVNFFSRNKELIKEAVEFHLNQAQGFLATYDMSYSAAQEIIRKKLAKEGEYTNREPHIGFEQNCLER